MKISYFRAQPFGLVDFFNPDFVSQNPHRPPCRRVWVSILERLINRIRAFQLNEGSETLHRYGLIHNVSRGELHDRTVLVANPEAADRLPPVRIKRPHRNSLQTCQTGQKAGEWLGLIKLLDNEFLFFKTVIRHNVLSSTS
ncbi:hypothetical protein D3C73_1389460 [compost metagenome]